jgi:hypothetical protein
MRLRDFQQDFNRNFKKIAGLMGELADDLTGSLDQAQMRRLLNSALDWVRPYHLSIGFRVRKLSRSQVEAVIPDRTHNLNSQNELEEGVVVSVAQQMAKLLIARWEVPVEWEVVAMTFGKLHPLKSTLIARLQWEDLAREALRAELVAEATAEQEFFIHLYDLQDMRVADVQVTVKVRMPQSLTRKGSHGDHSERN